MIKPILNHFLFASEFYTLVKRIITAIENSSIDEALKTMFLARIKEHFAVYDAALNRKKVNPLTAKMEEQDDNRDNLFLGLRTSSEALTYHWDEAIREAAAIIVEIIRRNGWSIQNEGYTAESAGINALISELTKEPAATCITTTSLGEWVTRLDNSQKTFEATSTQREELDAIEQPILSTTRKQLNSDLQSALNYLESMAQFNTTAELEELINTINEIITSVTSTAKARKTRRETEKTND
ncbi:DUF6261 family protein [Carboxylicivirga marina]|uniref:DUF6261 family protein n=1 Tax=Carboxylicivirga marina TaxID=2800988 RepID=UPI002594A7B2|nr:DUF6261 family protein [uncultured Carboxylicivirga sp.]